MLEKSIPHLKMLDCSIIEHQAYAYQAVHIRF